MRSTSRRCLDDPACSSDSQSAAVCVYAALGGHDALRHRRAQRGAGRRSLPRCVRHQFAGHGLGSRGGALAPGLERRRVPSGRPGSVLYARLAAGVLAPANDDGAQPTDLGGGRSLCALLLVARNLPLSARYLDAVAGAGRPVVAAPPTGWSHTDAGAVLGSGRCGTCGGVLLGGRLLDQAARHGARALQLRPVGRAGVSGRRPLERAPDRCRGAARRWSAGRGRRVRMVVRLGIVAVLLARHARLESRVLRNDVV